MELEFHAPSPPSAAHKLLLKHIANTITNITLLTSQMLSNLMLTSNAVLS